MTTPAQDDILIRERDEARADRDHLIEAIRNACRVAGVSLATPRNPVADIKRLGSMARDWWDRGQAAESRHAKSLADARLAAHRDGALQGAAERDRLQGELAAAQARALATTHGEALVEVPYTTKPDVGDVVRGGWARAEHKEKTDGR